MYFKTQVILLFNVLAQTGLSPFMHNYTLKIPYDSFFKEIL